VVYAGFADEHVATIFLERASDRVSIRIEPAEGIALRGVPQDGRMRPDSDGSPTVIELDGIRFHVIARGGRLALRIKDERAPTRTGFSGIERYDVDESWRIAARFEPEPSPRKIGLATVVGVDVASEVFGRVRFERDGHLVSAVLFPAGNGRSYLRFADATNGAGTYAIGRYLSVDPPRDDGTVMLDFNRAYNPPCAFTPFATCTIAPESNTFPFAVSAGERWD
jgi:uncharacterized protein (DUF1684 family)